MPLVHALSHAEKIRFRTSHTSCMCQLWHADTKGLSKILTGGTGLPMQGPSFRSHLAETATEQPCSVYSAPPLFSATTAHCLHMLMQAIRAVKVVKTASSAQCQGKISPWYQIRGPGCPINTNWYVSSTEIHLSRLCVSCSCLPIMPSLSQNWHFSLYRTCENWVGQGQADKLL